MGLWSWIRSRGVGGKPEEEPDLRDESGGEDPREGRGDVPRRETGYGVGLGAFGGPGLAAGEAIEAAKADLDETKPRRDPKP